jgi:hypothetical protein
MLVGEPSKAPAHGAGRGRSRHRRSDRSFRPEPLCATASRSHDGRGTSDRLGPRHSRHVRRRAIETDVPERCGSPLDRWLLPGTVYPRADPRHLVESRRTKCPLAVRSLMGATLPHEPQLGRAAKTAGEEHRGRRRVGRLARPPGARPPGHAVSNEPVAANADRPQGDRSKRAANTEDGHLRILLNYAGQLLLESPT